MTIGKVLTRLLCLCLLCALLSACSQKEEDYPFETLISPEEDTQAAGDPVESYRVVVASDCSAGVLSAAHDLAARLTEKLSLPAVVVYDRQTDLPGGNVMEIVLGAADRTGVGALMRNMRRDDSLCRMVEGRLVIGGVHESATLAALERFYAEIFPGATVESLMHPDGGFSHVGTYAKGKVLLNGFDLSEYCLVLPDDATAEWRKMAESLRDRIADASGYWLKLTKKSAFDGVGKRIELYHDTKDTLARIVPDDSGIVLSGQDLFGVSVAVRELYGLLLANETDGTCDCRITHTVARAYQQTSYEIAAVLADHWLPLEHPSYLEEIVGPVLETQADAVLLGAITPDDRSYITPNLPGYTPVEVAQSGEQVLALYEARDCMSFVDGSIGALSYTVVRMGDETDGFFLVYISGSVTETQPVVLPRSVKETELPVVIVTHVAGARDAVVLEDATRQGYELSFAGEYAFAEQPYAFACYATAGAFQITQKPINARGGCMPFHVERTSVF